MKIKIKCKKQIKITIKYTKELFIIYKRINFADIINIKCRI